MAFDAGLTVQAFKSSGALEVTLSKALTKDQRAKVHAAARVAGVSAEATGNHPNRVLKLTRICSDGRPSQDPMWLQKADAAALKENAVAAAKATVTVGTATVRVGSVESVQDARKGTARKRAITTHVPPPSSKRARAPPRVRE